MVYYTTYVVHTKIFFWDFDNDSYAQNSEIILTIRIQKNFFKIPIGKFFEKLSKSKKKFVCTTYVVYYTTFVGQSYHIRGILYHICGILYHIYPLMFSYNGTNWNDTHTIIFLYLDNVIFVNRMIELNILMTDVPKWNF